MLDEDSREKFELMLKELEAASLTAAKKNESLKNFVTNPPKRGTGYGFVDVTISKPYEYIPSEFDALKEQELKEKHEAKKLNISNRPFISASKSVDFFDPLVFHVEEKSMLKRRCKSI